VFVAFSSQQWEIGYAWVLGFQQFCIAKLPRSAESHGIIQIHEYIQANPMFTYNMLKIIIRYVTKMCLFLGFQSDPDGYEYPDGYQYHPQIQVVRVITFNYCIDNNV
jgi:hypothetical protein